MSNYIKIPMEDGTTLTTSALAASTISGGGTITGYTARNGVAVITSSGEGAGATVDVTIGDRALDGASATFTTITNYGTLGDVGFTTNAASDVGLLAQAGGATFDITTDAAQFITAVALNAVGTGYEVGDVIVIDVPGGANINNSGGAQTISVVALADSDLAAAADSDLIFTIVDGGTGYANGDDVYLAMEDPSGTELAWTAVIDISILGLVGYLDGPYVLLPASNILCTTPNPMTASSPSVIVLYADAQVGGDIKNANITFNGITTTAEDIEITQALNTAILKANQAENSQPTLELPTGVSAIDVEFL